MVEDRRSFPTYPRGFPHVRATTLHRIRVVYRRHLRFERVLSLSDDFPPPVDDFPHLHLQRHHLAVALLRPLRVGVVREQNVVDEGPVRRVIDQFEIFRKLRKKSIYRKGNYLLYYATDSINKLFDILEYLISAFLSIILT